MVSVTLGVFSVVTAEILPIGLLTSIGSSFTVSDGTAGLMMTMPGFLATVSAPLVTAAIGRADRRRVLAALVLPLALADFLAAAASDYWLVLVSRVPVGVTIGGFWSIGAGLAGRLVPAGSVGRGGTTETFSAIPPGSVLGVSLGTYIGEAAGWRTAFLAMGGFTLVVLVLLLLAVPPLPSDGATRLGVPGGTLRSTDTRFALAATLLVTSAHFGTHTCVTPFLERVTHAGPGLVTLCLPVHGAAGIAGDFLGGAAAARRPRAAFATVAATRPPARPSSSPSSAGRTRGRWSCWSPGAPPTEPYRSARRPGSPGPPPSTPRRPPSSSPPPSRPPSPWPEGPPWTVPPCWAA